MARLRRLPVLDGPGGLRLHRADTFASRLLGLMGLRSLPPDAGLLLTRTRCVHTFGMRFDLDLVWLGPGGDVIRIDHGVRRRRICRCTAARAVVELPAGQARTSKGPGLTAGPLTLLVMQLP